MNSARRRNKKTELSFTLSDSRRSLYFPDLKKEEKKNINQLKPWIYCIEDIEQYLTNYAKQVGN